MQLADFKTFEPFNKLRQKMNACQLGHFELFDPYWHLTGDERSQLARKGVLVDRTSVQMLLDFTVVYKNSRVLVCDEEVYHIACCDALPSTRRLRIAASLQGASSSDVCSSCLQRLNYDGFDLSKARRENYSRRVRDSFQLTEFWRRYPLYPVSEKREMRRPLEPSFVTESSS